jgi:aspartyl-tRNA(Asn)/glutamyl-tRNA(Gln) amidotransferase subunit C
MVYSVKVKVKEHKVTLRQAQSGHEEEENFVTKVSKTDVEQIAQLARLELTEAEKQKYQTELSAILGYVDTIAEVDTNGVEPTAQVTGLSDVLRDDVKEVSTLSKDQILSNAPEVKNGYIKVKSVLD